MYGPGWISHSFTGLPHLLFTNLLNLTVIFFLGEPYQLQADMNNNIHTLYRSIFMLSCFFQAK